MAVRYRSATPGTLLSLAAAIILALVSFNTPLLKSQYFLMATYDSSSISGTLKLGTLGYCLDSNCTGPTVGYEFDPNTVFGVTVFNIPKTVTKYLTYTLILHIIALAMAVCSMVFGLLSHISSLSVLCFPTCFAALGSSVSLLALVFDLVIFYIAKARIDDVDGASASIGISVWLTLAAWLLCGFAGCAYGIGRCCVGRRNTRDSGDPKNAYQPASSQGPDDLRLQAIRDEQLRKKEQGLPSFQELERTPLTATEDEDNKYLYDGSQNMPGGLRRDGSVINGVGTGHGRRYDRTPVNGYPAGAGYGQTGWSQDQYGAATQRPLSPSAMTHAGEFVGVGAGGAGVERPEPAATGYGYGQGDHQYYDQNYHDPYAQQQNDPYNQQQQQNYDPYARQYSSSSDPYQNSYGAQANQQQQHSYPPTTTTPMPMPTATPAPPPAAARQPTPRQSGYDYYNYDGSSQGHGQRVSQHSDAYGGYDDGLGGIGRAATSDIGHSRDYTGATFGVTPPPAQPQQGYGAPIQQPQPQHLVGHGTDSPLLRSPASPHDYQTARDGIVGYPSNMLSGTTYNQQEQDGAESVRPPSYGAVAGSSQYPQEKSSYRHS